MKYAPVALRFALRFTQDFALRFTQDFALRFTQDFAQGIFTLK